MGIFMGIFMNEDTCEAKLPNINGNVADHIEADWPDSMLAPG